MKTNKLLSEFISDYLLNCYTKYFYFKNRHVSNLKIDTFFS